MGTATVIETPQQVATPLLAAFFSLAELAKELGVSRKTLDRRAAGHKGPARTRVGRRVVYRREAVTAWLRACEHSVEQRDQRRGARRSKLAS